MTHIYSAFNKTLRIRTFYRKYHYNSHLIKYLLDNTCSNSNHCSSIETEFEHFFENLYYSSQRNMVQVELKPVAIKLKITQCDRWPIFTPRCSNTLKFEHFFDIISILFISKKSVQYHCRWNLNQLRSSWKLLNAIDDPYLVRVPQNTSNSDILSQISL